MDVLQARPSDSKGYTRLTLADPVGQPAAGVIVTCTVGEDVVHEITLHGQTAVDVPEGAIVNFPDGSSWEPEAKKK